MKIKKPDGNVISFWKLRTLVSIFTNINLNAKASTKHIAIPGMVTTLVDNGLNGQVIDKDLLDTTYTSLLPNDVTNKNSPTRKIDKRIRSTSYQLTEVMSLMTNNTARKKVEEILDFDKLLAFPITNPEMLDDFSIALMKITSVIIPNELANLKDAINANKAGLPVGKVSRRVFKMMALVGQTESTEDKDLLFWYVEKQTKIADILIKAVCEKGEDKIHLTGKRKHDLLKLALWQPLTLDQMNQHLNELHAALIEQALEPQESPLV